MQIRLKKSEIVPGALASMLAQVKPESNIVMLMEKTLDHGIVFMRDSFLVNVKNLNCYVASERVTPTWGYVALHDFTLNDQGALIYLSGHLADPPDWRYRCFRLHQYQQTTSEVKVLIETLRAFTFELEEF